MALVDHTSSCFHSAARSMTTVNTQPQTADFGEREGRLLKISYDDLYIQRVGSTKFSRSCTQVQILLRVGTAEYVWWWWRTDEKRLNGLLSRGLLLTVGQCGWAIHKVRIRAKAGASGVQANYQKWCSISSNEPSAWANKNIIINLLWSIHIIPKVTF